jgi:DNA-binding MarR family transcriptional regulator
VALIDDLERAGYVKRERNPDDRRAYVITLTAAGRKMQARADEAVDVDAVHSSDASPSRSCRSPRLLARLSGRSD